MVSLHTEPSFSFFLRNFWGLFRPLWQCKQRLERGREKGDDMQQMTTCRTRTRVSCTKASAFIHGVPTLSTALSRHPLNIFFELWTKWYDCTVMKCITAAVNIDISYQISKIWIIAYRAIYCFKSTLNVAGQCWQLGRPVGTYFNHFSPFPTFNNFSKWCSGWGSVWTWWLSSTFNKREFVCVFVQSPSRCTLSLDSQM